MSRFANVGPMPSEAFDIAVEAPEIRACHRQLKAQLGRLPNGVEFLLALRGRGWSEKKIAWLLPKLLAAAKRAAN